MGRQSAHGPHERACAPPAGEPSEALARGEAANRRRLSSEAGTAGAGGESRIPGARERRSGREVASDDDSRASNEAIPPTSASGTSSSSSSEASVSRRSSRTEGRGEEGSTGEWIKARSRPSSVESELVRLAGNRKAARYARGVKPTSRSHQESSGEFHGSLEVGVAGSRGR